MFKSFVSQRDYFTSKNKSETVSNQTTDVTEDTPSVYKDYSKEDYDADILNKRPIVLFFTSNWCMECLNQEEVNKEVFGELNKEAIIGFKIHILDSETTTETQALAQKFDVTKESTFVILNRSGAVHSKYVGSINKELLKIKIIEVGDIK